MVTGLEWVSGWQDLFCNNLTTTLERWEHALTTIFSKTKKIEMVEELFRMILPTYRGMMHVNTCFYFWKQKRKNELTFVLWFINQETVLMIIFDSTPSSQVTDCSTFLSRRVRQEVWEQFHLTVELMIIDERMTIKYWIFSISWSTSWKSLWMNVLCFRLRCESMFQSQVCTTWRNKDRKK